jgi:hypothetical protein
MLGRDRLETFDAGTLAGAGCFRCEECGFAVALHERDEVPACPHCGGREFKRSSIFGELSVKQEPIRASELHTPDWLSEARGALERSGDWCLNVSQPGGAHRCRARLYAHEPACSIAATRCATSRNSMSTANTR